MKKSANKRRKRNGKRKRTSQSQIIRKILSLAMHGSAPHPRMKLPDAFRAIGLDEHAIAQCFAEQLKQILEPAEAPRISRKLLLDWLKEWVRILYPLARRGDAPEQPQTIELVHFVPRPDRSGDPQPAGSSPSQSQEAPVASGAANSFTSPVLD